MSDDKTSMDSGRRDFLKKSLVGGAVLWSAPVVTSLPGGKAWAQTYGVCNCNAEAFGLFVSIPLLGINTTLGENGCVASVNLGDNTTARVRAQTVCSDDFDSVNAGCSGEATIASIGVRTGPTATPSLLVNATVLFAGASALCAPCGTSGDFSAANVTLSGSLVGGTINVNVGAACNTDVGGLGLVVVNEQFCTGETLTVNALHITVPGVLDVIAAHAEAGSTGCPCATC